MILRLRSAGISPGFFLGLMRGLGCNCSSRWNSDDRRDRWARNYASRLSRNFWSRAELGFGLMGIIGFN